MAKALRQEPLEYSIQASMCWHIFPLCLMRTNTILNLMWDFGITPLAHFWLFFSRLVYCSGLSLSLKETPLLSFRPLYIAIPSLVIGFLMCSCLSSQKYKFSVILNYNASTQGDKQTLQWVPIPCTATWEFPLGRQLSQLQDSSHSSPFLQG